MRRNRSPRRVAPIGICSRRSSVRCLAVVSWSLLWAALAACGEKPTSNTDDAPEPKQAQLLWSTSLSAGSSLAVDDARVYVSGVGTEATVLSRQTGTVERTIANAGFVGRGALIALHDGVLVAGTRLRAFDGATGASRWEATVGSASLIPVQSNDSIVFLADGGNAGGVRAVRVADGSTKWLINIRPVDLPVETGDAFSVGGLMLAGNDLVATYTKSRSLSVLATGVVLIDASTGDMRWSTMTLPEGGALGQPAISGGVVVATGGYGDSFGMSLAGGALLWSSARIPGVSVTSGTVRGSAVGVNGFVLTTEGGSGKSALGAASGQKHWRAIDLREISALSALPLVLSNGRLVDWNLFGGVIAIELAEEFRAAWSYSLPAAEYPRAFAARGDTIYVSTGNRVIALLAPQ